MSDFGAKSEPQFLKENVRIYKSSLHCNVFLTSKLSDVKGDVKICQERCQGGGATHILFSLAERKWGGILGKQSPGRLEEVLSMWESVTRGVMPLILLKVIGQSNSFREVQPYVNPHLYHLLQVT